MKRISILILVLFGVCLVCMGQDSIRIPKTTPLPVDLLFGNNAFYFQETINKKIGTEPSSRFGLFNSTSYQGGYDNDKTKNEFMCMSFVTFEIIKHIMIYGGAGENSSWGFRPIVGIRLAFISPRFMLVADPGYYPEETHNLDLVVQIEYKPQIANGIALFIGAKSAYSYNTDAKAHARSYTNPRLGIVYKQFIFGIGANLNQYGATKVYKENYGLFLRYMFK